MQGGRETLLGKGDAVPPCIPPSFPKTFILNDGSDGRGRRSGRWLPVSVSKSEARHGQAVSRSRRRPGASERDPGCGPCLRRVLPRYKKRECLWTFSFFVHSNRGQHGCSGERLQPSQLHVIFGDVPRCSLLWGSGGDQHPDQRKVFSGWGESARGGGAGFNKVAHTTHG